ncbi:MAG: hypothetical protein ABI446_00540 [Gemmatimonadaceae bacterium]
MTPPQPLWLRVLAWSQIAAAPLIALEFINIDWDLERGHVLIALLGIAFAILAGYSGYLLLRRRELGVSLSLITQALQVVGVRAAGQYAALAGLKATVLFSSAGEAVYAGAGGEFLISSTRVRAELDAFGFTFQSSYWVLTKPLATAELTIAINFAAIYFIYRLWPLWYSSESDTAASDGNWRGLTR